MAIGAMHAMIGRMMGRRVGQPFWMDSSDCPDVKDVSSKRT
jgi:hypothetical protein